MPSGSSVRLPGWDGLLEVGRGNAWAPRGVSGWELSCDNAITRKANDDYQKRTADPLDLNKATDTFVFVTSRRWHNKREWLRERREEGEWRDVRAYDADDLATWLGQSREVTQWFTGVIYRPPFDYEAVSRIEDRQVETADEMTAGFAEMSARLEILPSLLASSVTQAQPLDSEPIQDTEQQRLTEKIDAALDLIQQGLVVTARRQLERIKDETKELPDLHRFRLVTNLAICALGEDKFDEASSLLNEAHEIQPENRTGITNAALAAQLQQNPKRAAELAQRALALDPHDSNAAANLISALRDMGENEQLEEFIASVEWIAQESASASALAGVHVQQARYDDAIILYQYLIEVDPDDVHAHLGLSQCLLTYAQVERPLMEYSNESLSRLLEAESAADRAATLLQSTQLNARRHEALVLRAGARTLLGKLDEAMRDVDMMLGEMPEHQFAALLKGLILLKKGLPGEARKSLERIQDPEVRAASLLPLADACLESGDATAAVALLKGSFKLDPPEWEDLGRAESLMRAEATTEIDDSVGPVLDAAIERYSDNAGLFILAAIHSNLQGNLESAVAALTKATYLASEPHRQALQTQLGHLYAGMGRFVDATEQFSKACGDDASHPAAVPMLLSLFNSKQYRKALDLARNIREICDSPPKVVIDVEVDVLDYIGDVRTATLRHRELCSREDSTPEDLIRLAIAEFRYGEVDAALETVLKIDVSDLNPQALMKLAYMKRFLGATDYLKDAYLARRNALNIPDSHLGYFRLFQGKDEDWEEPRVVIPGCAVLIKNGEEEQWWQILEDGEEPYGPRELSLEHNLAQRLLGRSVGEIIVLRQGLEDLSYKITAIQSKYVRAYQETAEEFSTRFPDNMSLSRVKLDSNFTQIFQSIELRHQHVSNAEGLYQSQQLPFASFCSLIGSSTLEIWPGYTAQPTARLHFGTGSEKELDESGELLRDAEAIVLDIIALLTIHRLELAEHLRKRFSRVTIPQHVFDEIQNNVYEMRLDRVPSSHIGKDSEGRYTLTDISEDVWKERQAYALSVLELAKSFERIPSYPMLAASEPEKTIDVLTLAGAGAVYSGDEQSEVTPVLVSDDLVQSQVARSFGVETVNSQAILIELRRSDVITAEEYSSSIEQLARMHYWFVRISAEDILQSFESSGYQITPATQAMLSALWGPDCTEDAAVSIGAEVVASLVKRPLIQQHLDLLLFSVMEAIQRGRHTSQVLTKFKTEIAMRLTLAPLQCNQILKAVDIYLWTRSQPLSPD